jgi:hypothetical protein
MADHLSAFQVLQAIESRLEKSATFREVVRNPLWHWRELRAAVRSETVERNVLRRAAKLDADGGPGSTDA